MSLEINAKITVFSLQFREITSELYVSNGLTGLLMQREHAPNTGLTFCVYVLKRYVGMRVKRHDAGEKSYYTQYTHGIHNLVTSGGYFLCSCFYFEVSKPELWHRQRESLWRQISDHPIICVDHTEVSGPSLGHGGCQLTQAAFLTVHELLRSYCGIWHRYYCGLFLFCQGNGKLNILTDWFSYSLQKHNSTSLWTWISMLLCAAHCRDQ